MKEVKKGKKRGKNSKSFYLAIFNYIKVGKSPSFIKNDLKISKQKVYYYTKQLKQMGFIGKHKNGDWFIKVKTFSLGTRKPHPNLHALHIKIPILSIGNLGVQKWEIREELRNWTPTYKTFTQLGGLTIKNNNNKSISIFVHSREIKDLKEIDVLAYDVRNWALGYFRDTFNTILDIIHTETKTLHLATEDKQSEEMLGKGERFELDLDKKAEKIFPKDKIDGKAWLDGSPFNFTAETNDKEWKREYLSMPFKSRESLQLLHYIAKNYASHVGIVEKLDKLLTSSKIRKHIVKKVKEKNQTKLGDFL